MQELDRRTLLQMGVMGVTAGTGLGRLAGRGQAMNISHSQPTFTSRASAISPPDTFTEPLWTTQFDGSITQTVGEGELYIVDSSPTDGDRLLALNIQTGEERWSRAISTTQNPVTVTADRVLEIDQSTVIAYERSSGEQQWTVQYPGEVDFSSLVLREAGEETLLITSRAEGATEKRLLGVNTTTGDVRWDKTVSLPGEFVEATLPYSPADPDIYVMFATTTGHQILDLNATTGEVNETHTVPIAGPISSGNPTSSFLIEESEDYLVVRSFGLVNEGGIVVVQIFSSFSDEPDLVLSGVNVHQIDSRPGEKKYVVIDDERLRGVASPSGETLWEQSINTDVTQRIRSGTTSDLFYNLRFPSTSTGEYETEIAARSVTTGEIEWSRSVAENSGQPNIGFYPGDNTVLVSRNNGEFVSLDTTTGEVGDWAISLASEGDIYDIYQHNDVVVASAETFSQDPASATLSIFPAPDTVPSDSSPDGVLDVSLSASQITAGTTTDVTVAVSDNTTGDSVEDATVSISDLNLSVTTDLNGEATLSINTNDPDEYTISVSKDGYADTTTTLTVEDSESSETSFQDVLGTIGDYNSGNASFQDVLQAIADYNANN
ncbi:outer membrane protein assembly factor BamB family protein [Haloplanus rubicundus]|uniref:Pyrrolo-quinoline quinone repeat domain-containing protein n=1 Tax=Haloplanus rubicundus TaxID=1547898 RepID=A0A345EF88_9EURY|nr:PQQ-binding-like beta-propeller repeat protein [Haloplanus rubicundus]AXG10860.1 hypothetical protein DU484_13960 [Haloplanus rubicundus]